MPCFATLAPQAQATNAAVVETLNIPMPEPPVPQVSTNLSLLTSTLAESFLMILAAPKTSSTVSPFIFKAIKNAPICASVVLPSSKSNITSDISLSLRFNPEVIFEIAEVMFIYPPKNFLA